MLQSSVFICILLCLSLFASSLSAQESRAFTHTKSFPLSKKWSLDFVIKSPYKEACPESSKPNHFGIYYGDQIRMQIVNQYDGRIFLVQDYKVAIMIQPAFSCGKLLNSYTSNLGEVLIDSTNTIVMKSYTRPQVFYIDFSISKETDTRSRTFWRIFGVDIKSFRPEMASEIKN